MRSLGVQETRRPVASPAQAEEGSVILCGGAQTGYLLGANFSFPRKNAGIVVWRAWAARGGFGFFVLLCFVFS